MVFLYLQICLWQRIWSCPKYLVVSSLNCWNGYYKWVQSVFLNPAILNLENFECRYWLDRRKITSCFFKLSPSSCLKKMVLLQKYVKFYDPVPCENIWIHTMFLCRKGELPCASRVLCLLKNVLRLFFHWYSQIIKLKNRNCCPS